jgi:hypothetical protein
MAIRKHERFLRRVTGVMAALMWVETFWVLTGPARHILDKLDVLASSGGREDQ